MEHLTAITQEEANSLRKKEVAGKWHSYRALKVFKTINLKWSVSASKGLINHSATYSN